MRTISIAIFLLLSVLAGCTTVPGSNYSKAESTALARPEATRLGRQLDAQIRAHAGVPGFRLVAQGVGRFGRLTREQLLLLESFLRSRGNLRDMERELSISYPTVRSRVEALVRALGFGPRADADDPIADDPAGAATAANAATAATSQTGDAVAARQAILERLGRHEISADEAAAAIRALGRTDR